MPHIIKAPYPDTIPVTVTAQASGTQAIYSPNTPPFDKGILQNGFHIAEPQTAWTSGQYARLGNGDHCRWQGSSWKSVGNGYSPDRLGGAPEVLPFSYEDIVARGCTGYGTWEPSDKFTPLDGRPVFWNGAGRWGLGYSPLQPNLMLNFMHNEGSGQFATDWSPTNYGNWLGLGGGVESQDPSWAPLGLVFDFGQQTIGSHPNSYWLGGLTIVCTVYSYSASHYHGFISLNTGNNLNCPIDFWASDEATPRLNAVRGNAGGYTHWSGPLLDVGVTTMIGVRFASASINVGCSFIKNNVVTAATQVGSTSTGNATGAGQYLYVGRRQDGICQMHGQIGPLWAYNTYLSDTQITDYVYPAMKLNVNSRIANGLP